MERCGCDGRRHGVGRRALVHDPWPASFSPAAGRACLPSWWSGELDGPPYSLARRFCGGCLANRGGGGDRGGDRDPPAPLAGVARRTPGGRSRSRSADRRRDHCCPSSGPRTSRPMFTVRISHPQQRARPLPGGAGRGAQAAEQAPELQVSMWALPELIEAATRTGQTRLAADALERLAEATSIGQTDWAQGIHARCRALPATAPAPRLLSRSGDRLSRTRFRPDLARAHLLYGEWLRRKRRRTDARAQLRTAHDAFAPSACPLSPSGPGPNCRHRRDRPQTHPRHPRAAHPARDPDRSPGPWASAP